MKGLINNDIGEEYLLAQSWLSPAPRGPGYVLSRFEMRLIDYLYSMNEAVKASKPKE